GPGRSDDDRGRGRHPRQLAGRDRLHRLHLTARARGPIAVGGAWGLAPAAMSAVGAAPSKAAARAPAVEVIFDTDMALDVDDVGALALLHALADRGECRILAVGVSESMRAYEG